jgi:hypothetical protein
MFTHIYLMGVLTSFLIVAISFLIRLRRVHKYNKVYIVTLGDLFFALVCVSASWATALTFVLMCVKKDLEDKVIRKF